MSTSQPIKITVQTEGILQIEETLANRWGKADNMRPAIERIRKYYADELKQNVEKGGGTWGVWKPRRYAYTHPILDKTGKMKRSFKYNVGQKELVITNPVFYFKFHELGTKWLPVRKLWGVNEKDRSEIIDAIRDYIMED